MFKKKNPPPSTHRDKAPSSQQAVAARTYWLLLLELRAQLYLVVGVLLQKVERLAVKVAELRTWFRKSFRYKLLLEVLGRKYLRPPNILPIARLMKNRVRLCTMRCNLCLRWVVVDGLMTSEKLRKFILILGYGLVTSVVGGPLELLKNRHQGISRSPLRYTWTSFKDFRFLSELGSMNCAFLSQSLT